MTSGRWSALLSQRAGVTSLPLSVGFTVDDALFAEAIRILYFCATEPADWRAFRRDPMAWQEEIERWGDEHIPRKLRLEAENVALEIFNDAEENRHLIEPSDDTGSGN